MESWITTVVDERSAHAAVRLAESLRNTETKKRIVVAAASHLNPELFVLLREAFDGVLEFDVDNETPDSYEIQGRHASVNLLKAKLGVYLSPFLNVSRNCDVFFKVLAALAPEGQMSDFRRPLSNDFCFGFVSSETGNEPRVVVVALSDLLNLERFVLYPSIKTRNGNIPVAIVGMSCRFPGANNAEEFWNLVVSGKEAIREIPKRRLELTEGWRNSLEGGFLSVEVDEVDGMFFEMSRTELTFTDPQQRLALEVSWEALEDARMDPTSLKGSKLGVFSGCWVMDYSHLLTARNVLSNDPIRRYIGNGLGAVAGRLSYFFGGEGPSVAVESACSSAMSALALGMSSLRNGTSDVALVFGANLLLFPFDPQNDIIVSKDGRCRTFEENANGYGRAEGIATLVLKRLPDAIRDGDRIHSVLLGHGHCNKSLKGSLVTPDVEGQARAMRMALADAEVKPEDVEFLEIHGTGTAAGDLTEFLSVSKVFDEGVSTEKPLYLASVKANIGHTESTSGLAGVIKTTLALKRHVIPPHRKFQRLNKKLDFKGSRRLRIPQEEIPWDVSTGGRRVAGVNSFGLVGTYYHVIMSDHQSLEEYQAIEASKLLPPKWNVLAFSAKSEVSLRKTMKEYLTFFPEVPRVADVAFSAATTRAHFQPFRASFVADSSWTEVVKKLGQPEKFIKTCVSRPKVCFLFTGQGSQHSGMAKELYKVYPEFQRHFDLCKNILKSEHDLDLEDLLWNTSDDSNVLRNQTGIFVVEYCVSKFYESLGVTPVAVLGHSVGEFGAACVAGILSLKSALSLVIKRAQLLLALPTAEPSAMLAVSTDSNTIAEIISEYSAMFPGVAPEFSAVNAATQIVLGGSKVTIQMTKELLESRGISCVVLRTSHAFY